MPSGKHLIMPGRTRTKPDESPEPVREGRHQKVNRVTYENLHKVLDDPNNNWTRFIKRILFDVDSGVLDKFVPVFMNIALNSYSLRTQAIENTTAISHGQS